MNAVQALIVICLLAGISYWLQRLSDTLSDVRKVLENYEKILKEDNNNERRNYHHEQKRDPGGDSEAES